MARKTLDIELEKIGRDILKMSDMVCEVIENSEIALRNRDMKLSTKLINNDDNVDSLYKEIEERCIRAIALHQPVAKDLRFITAAMNVASNIERIGDYSVDTAKIVPYIVDEKMNIDEIRTMTGICKEMTRNSVEGFIKNDSKKVELVKSKEEQVDELYKCIFPLLKKIVMEKPERITLTLNILLVARHLERTGDHAVNIANRAMYAISGGEEYL
jgi:phosphate transport system protein